jgi:hypothetical protein
MGDDPMAAFARIEAGQTKLTADELVGKIEGLNRKLTAIRDDTGVNRGAVGAVRKESDTAWQDHAADARAVVGHVSPDAQDRGRHADLPAAADLIEALAFAVAQQLRFTDPRQLELLGGDMSTISGSNGTVLEVLPAADGVTIMVIPDDVDEPIATIDLPPLAAAALIQAVAVAIASRGGSA